MSSIGSFGTFTTARLGIYAAQKGLSVVGNNIANINTPGYTRQRLDQSSFKSGGADRYASQNDVKVGNGVMCDRVSQLRDPYLDIRYRTEMASYGATSTTMQGLDEIANILDEIGRGMTADDEDGIIHAQFSDFLKSLEQVSVDSSAQTNDTLARASAEELCKLFNQYAGRLETLEDGYRTKFKQAVSDVNSILTSIRDLNASIRKSDIHGDPALELRDDRNLLIDQLSEFLNIDVIYSMEDLGGGQEVEKLTIRLGNSNPDKTVNTDISTLVDGIFAAQLAMPRENKAYDKDFEIYDKNSEAYVKAVQQLELTDADPVTVNGVEYTKKEDLDAAIEDYLKNVTSEDLKKSYKYLDENNAGTNDILDAFQEPNENYDLTISKLYSKYGEEWADPKSITKLIDTPQGLAKKAVYTIPLTTSDNWANGDTIQVGDQTITVGTDISVANANKTSELAKVIASKLNSAEGSEYTVRAVTSGDPATTSLVFTAKKAGAINGSGPKTEPDPQFTAGNDATKTITFGTRDTTVAGADVDPTKMPTDSHTVKADGTTTDVTYYELDGQWYQTTTVTKHTQEVKLDDNDLHGALQAYRELLTETGEFVSDKTITDIDESAAIKRGIPYYRNSLDLLALKFATAFNAQNTGYAVDEKGTYLKDNGDGTYSPVTLTYNDGTGDITVTLTQNTELTQAIKDALIANGGFVTEKDADDNDIQVASLEKYLDKNGTPMGGALFSNRNDGDDTTDITAANISVSHSWSTGALHIVPTFIKLFEGEGEHTTQQDNVGHMISLMDKRLDYNPRDLIGNASSSHLFHGSFQEMLDNMCSVLGNDQRTINTKLNDHARTATEIDMSRDGVSGVDLNDEAMNLMQYSKALNAAYRLMTTIDEALERLINNTGVVGR